MYAAMRLDKRVEAPILHRLMHIRRHGNRIAIERDLNKPLPVDESAHRDRSLLRAGQLTVKRTYLQRIIKAVEPALPLDVQGDALSLFRPAHPFVSRIAAIQIKQP